VPPALSPGVMNCPGAGLTPGGVGTGDWIAWSGTVCCGIETGRVGELLGKAPANCRNPAVFGEWDCGGGLGGKEVDTLAKEVGCEES
jgi:hypothetical protein